MKDLDFDELDKAVSSMVGGAAPSTATAPAESVTVPVGKVTSRPAPAAGRSQAVSITVSAGAKPAASPAAGDKAITPGRRSARLPASRSGKTFSDIMPAKPVSKAPSRTLAAVKPVSTSVMPEPVAPSIGPQPALSIKPKPPKLEQPSATSRPAPSPEADRPAKTTEAWPDPLDFHDEFDAQSPVPAPRAKKPGSVDDLLNDDDDEPTQSQTSPFLPDAKVEKRPLGAFTAGASTAAPVTPDTAEPSLGKEAPDSDPKTDLATKLEQAPDVAELIQTEADKAEALAETTKEESKAVEKVEKQVLESAQASITPQYKTPEKAPDHSHRPVFDTKEYHPPLLEATVHGHKSSGGAGKFVLGLLIVALLALGGYFVWMYFA